MRLWIVAYDIADNKRRREMAAVLTQRMVRVQESVFEAILSANEIADTLAQTRPLLEAESDKLRAYPVSLRQTERCQRLGNQPPPEQPNRYWII